MDWQERLVRRTGLPSRAALALVSVVADHLLEPLATRADLDPTLARVLRARVDLRLEGRQVKHLPPELAFEEAALHGDQATMLRLLAEGAALPPLAVDHAVRLRSAKALISLCWKAGFSQRCATLAQTVLAQIAPAATIQPGPDGSWPLSEAEMKWQIELMAEPA